MCLQYLLLVVAGSLLPVEKTLALDFLSSNSHNPIVALFGLPAARAPLAGLSQAAHSRGFSATTIELGVDHANIFAGGQRSDEALRLDGETTTVSVYANRQIGRCWQAAVETSFLSHISGSLDAPIERWHDIFALPSANRSQTPRDLIEFHYRLPGQNIEINEATKGIGDTSVHFMVDAACLRRATASTGPTWSTALRFGLKFPTGQLSTLTGSDTTDGYIELIDKPRVFKDRFTMRSRVGLFLPGESDTLKAKRDIAAFSTMSLAWSATPTFSLLTQLELHSPLFHSELTEIGHWALQLGMGARFKFAAGRALDVALYEDLVIDTAPDIVLHARLSQRF